MKKKLCIILVLIMVAANLLTACSNSTSTDQSAAGKKDSLIIGQYGDPPNLDTHNCINDNGMRVNTNIYDYLVRLDKDYNPVPNLAESWEISDDGLEYIFYIRDGVKFHNGDELKISDVVFSMNRGIEAPSASISFTGVKKAEAYGDNAVKITLEKLNPQFIMALAAPVAGIVSEKAVTEAGDDYARNPIGTGPYKFVNWVAGEKIELEAFEDYYLGAPEIKHLTFRAIEDQNSAMISLEKGDIDAYIDPNPNYYDRLREDKNIELKLGKSFMFEFLILNTSKPPFDNKLVRQGLSHAIDKEALLHGIFYDEGDIIDTFATEEFAGYTDDISKYDYDLDKAKALFTEAGYGDGFEFDAYVYLDISAKQAQIIQNSLSQIGVTLNVKLLERSAYDVAVNSGEHDMLITANTYSGLDLSDILVYNMLHSQGPRNRARYSNPEMDKLLDAAGSELDPEKRADIQKEILKVATEDVPYITTIWTYKSIAINKNLQGVWVHPRSMYNAFDYSWTE